MDTVLAAGGAGHVGSHACNAGFLPAAFDSLAAGWEGAAEFDLLEWGGLLDRERIGQAIRALSPVAALHFAAPTGVGASVASPGLD